MKIRSLLCGLFAVAVISACKQEEPVIQPSLDVNKTSANVSAAGEELTIEVTSNVDWSASADQDWVSVDPSSGKGSAEVAKVKVTVDPNETEDTRTAVVTVVADQLTKTLNITQSGAIAPEPVDVDVDGRQWCFTWEAMGVEAVLDLGVTEEGSAIIAYDNGGVWSPYIVAEYTVSKTDGTSGVIVLTLDGMSAEIPYSEATENTVHIECASLFLDNDCTLATELIQIEYSSTAGGNTLDGKQWIADMGGVSVLFDFGIAEEGMLSIALPSMDGTTYYVQIVGFYEIAPLNETSGVVTFYQYDWEWGEILEPIDIQYSDLGEASVNIICEIVFGVSDPVAFDLVKYPYEIELPGGGAGPQGGIPDGKYWFFNGNKVMAPLAEGEVSGFLPAEDGVDGASTEKNVFTLTYDPDYTCYTIQDSYGRYLGQTDETGKVTLTDVLPTDETYAYYLWVIELGYGENGEVDIYNASYYFDITYSSTDNNWALLDGGYEYPEMLPVLVPVE